MIERGDPAQGFFIRCAVPDDIPVLVSHHLRMFEELWDRKGTPLDLDQADRVGREYAAKLKKELPSGVCTAWVVGNNNAIVASGAISVMSYVPRPDDPGCRIAFLHSVFTEPPMRHHHYASRIVKEAVSFCREEGIGRIYLNASDEGRFIYEKQGFTPVDTMMLLCIPSGSCFI
ncbi:MAG: GNAT family N-acetyltransferase [Methanospirillaceae archaeon]|nr:GNAT family N-acetyltransferase [Methanospirillaceae archaeon]